MKRKLSSGVEDGEMQTAADIQDVGSLIAAAIKDGES